MCLQEKQQVTLQLIAQNNTVIIQYTTGVAICCFLFSPHSSFLVTFLLTSSYPLPLGPGPYFQNKKARPMGAGMTSLTHKERTCSTFVCLQKWENEIFTTRRPYL